jgi:hypothetical protein
MEFVQDIWKVVGGGAKGGIIVRQGKNVSSPEHPDRLGTGAKVRVVEKCADRFRYEMVMGKGPLTGWVSANYQGKELLVELFKTKKRDNSPDIKRRPQASRSESQDNQSSDCLAALDQLVADVKEEQHLESQHRETNCMENLDTLIPDDQQDAIRKYGQRMGEQSTNKLVGLKKDAFLTGKTGKLDLYSELSGNVVGAELVEDLGLRGMVHCTVETEQPTGQDEHEILDEICKICEPVCPVCCLPIGDVSYDCSDGSMRLHGECVAQWMVNEWRFEDEARQKQDLEKKKALHLEYKIGWDAKHIPRNDVAAGKLAMQEVPQGLVCLVSDEETKSIKLASTMEPAAAVNLEYLSVALEVRRREGHEPVFSLDPQGLNDKSMQKKAFAPEWLAGTTVGELLFQADYHLKELSMGEYEQPVVGMKSCFDFMEYGDDDKDWNAREWFIVRKAEVRRAESNVLIPFVKMGVEAREQTVKGNSLVDKQITRAHHPMVKYAEAFTKNFDLIAERKSVVFQLRELAKASVLAKHLLNAEVKLDELWFNLASGNALECCILAPQVWNERLHSRVQVQDGEIVDDSSTHETRGYGVYGGVTLGLDKFELTVPTSVRQAPSISRVAAFRPGFAAKIPQTAELAMKLSQAERRPDSRPTFTRALAKATAPTPAPTPKEKPKAIAPKPAMAQYAAPVAFVGDFPKMTARASPSPDAVESTSFENARRAYVPGGVIGGVFEFPILPQKLSEGLTARIQGVDLRLDNFDVSNPKQVQTEDYIVSSLDKCTAFGDFFWSSLESGEDLFKEEDRLMLKEVFNPALSDRRQEGELFTPPDVSHSYITKLRALVKEEELVRQRRKDIFLGKTFKMATQDLFFHRHGHPLLRLRAVGHRAEFPMV